MCGQQSLSIFFDFEMVSDTKYSMIMFIRNIILSTLAIKSLKIIIIIIIYSQNIIFVVGYVYSRYRLVGHGLEKHNAKVDVINDSGVFQFAQWKTIYHFTKISRALSVLTRRWEEGGYFRRFRKFGTIRFV